MKLGKALRSFSVFSRPESELVQQTVHGGVVISVDMIDSAGTSESDQYSSVHHMHLHKQRLDRHGRRLTKGDYKAPPADMITIVGGMIVRDSDKVCACTNLSKNKASVVQHVEDMEQELRDREGCHVFGDIDVKRLAGAMRLTVHMRDWMLLATTQAELQAAMEAAMAAPHVAGTEEVIEVHSDFTRANVSHHIAKFSFGPDFPGKVNPLDGFDRVVDHDYGTYEYYMKVVPTTYVSAMWRQTDSNVYSVAEYFVPGSRHAAAGETNVEKVPALEFHYDMSPLRARISYPNRGVGPFSVRLCAVLGGCFALTRWLDNVVHATLRSLSAS